MFRTVAATAAYSLGRDGEPNFSWALGTRHTLRGMIARCDALLFRGTNCRSESAARTSLCTRLLPKLLRCAHIAVLKQQLGLLRVHDGRAIVAMG
jgi:hypothetical protein